MENTDQNKPVRKKVVVKVTIYEDQAAFEWINSVPRLHRSYVIIEALNKSTKAIEKSTNIAMESKNPQPVEDTESMKIDFEKF